MSELKKISWVVSLWAWVIALLTSWSIFSFIFVILASFYWIRFFDSENWKEILDKLSISFIEKLETYYLEFVSFVEKQLVTKNKKEE